MTTEIVIDPTLQQYIIKVNDIEIDRASTYAQADDILSAYMRRFCNPDISILNSAISALDAVDQALTAELARIDADGMRVMPRWGDGFCAASGCTRPRTHDDTGFCCTHDAVATGNQCNCASMRMPEGDYLDADGMRVPAPVHCQQPDDLCDVHNPCPAHAADAAAYLAAEVDRQYSDDARFAEDPCCPCGMPALFFVQYPGKTYAYCPDCYRDLNASRPPLLAQCAAVIRRCLGSTTGAGSIIDELRRVDRALSTEGW